MGILFIQQVLILQLSLSNYKIAAIKLFEENSTRMSQSAVKVYRRMKIEVRFGKLII